MKRVGLVFIFVVAALARAHAGASAPAKENDESVLRMSPFEVSANSVDFKSWIKIGSPHYIVYTDATEKEADAVLRELEMLHRVTQWFFHRQALNLAPVTIVLPTSHSDWRKIERKGAIQWHDAVSDPTEKLIYFLIVQYDWQEKGLLYVRSELARPELHAINLHGPVWFEAGMDMFFETAVLKGDTITLGYQNQMRTSAIGMLGWLSWPKFFNVTPESPEYLEREKIDRFLGQSAVFEQYMLANPDPTWRARLLDWTARMEAGREPTEKEFNSVFGQNWKQWQSTMENFLNNGLYALRVFNLPKEVSEFSVNKFDLPIREMRELFVLAQILNQNKPASDAALDSILAKGLKTESLRELLVEACFKHHRADVAQKQLQLLVSSSDPNPGTYALVASARMKQRVPKISIGSRLHDDDVSEIRALCQKALEIEPRFVPAIDLLVWTEALGPKVGAENLAAIERHYQSLNGYASTSDAVAGMGVAAWRSGNLAWAGKIAHALAASPYADEDGRRIAGELLTELGEFPATATPVTGGK